MITTPMDDKMLPTDNELIRSINEIIGSKEPLLESFQKKDWFYQGATWMRDTYCKPILEEAQKDYEGMRDFQKKFIESDHERIHLQKENEKLKKQLEAALNVLSNLQGRLEVDEALKTIESLERGE